MSCAVQMHKSRDRQGTWVEQSIDGCNLWTSPEHYRCHIIYTKGTQSERISDTVFFKTKFITQPKLTPAGNVVKAIPNLTNALKGTKNIKRIQDIEWLKLLDKLLNNIPRKLTEMLQTPESRVENIQPSQQEEEELTHSTPTPKETSIIPMPTPSVQDN